MPSQQNRGPELLGVQIAFLVAAWVATLLRAYVKVVITKRHTLDDGVMYLSTALYSVYAAVAVLGIVKGGIGRHTSELDAGSIVIALKVWYTCEVLYAFISALIRTSICLFLLRLFDRGIHKTVKTVLQATIVAVWISSMVYLFIVVFQCDPPSYYWAKFEGLHGSCRSASLVPNATIGHSVVAAVSDWTIAILPMSILWQLQLKRGKKIRLLFFFGTGLMYVSLFARLRSSLPTNTERTGSAGIIMIIRIPYIKVLEISADFLYQTVDVALWSLLEPSIGIIAGCIATLRPLLDTCGLGKRSKEKSVSSWRNSMPRAILVERKFDVASIKIEDPEYAVPINPTVVSSEW
ncbi:integral membrane protein [Colletotrichum incanum]|uniref:Integral membrane protein n=1 Tax=Colletotrichum incanum TaxID=1573173 RepID=A0A162PJC0_COLIC|nr:integral membrane protein [Colletotrichum incanum]